MPVVVHTSKTDSHQKRGRIGRGFQEMLVLAIGATVESKGRVMEFSRDEQGSACEYREGFGDGAIMRLGDNRVAPIEVIPTGNILIDRALGVGGFPLS